jgi:glycine cleavage system H protein
MTVLFLLLMLIAFLAADHLVQRFRVRRVSQAVRERVASLLGNLAQIPAGIELALNHTWIKNDGGPVVTVGLDAFVATFLGTVGRIVLPEPGTAAGSVVLEDGARSLALALPVRGRVVAVNPGILRDPSGMHDDPYGRGWLLQIQPDHGAPRRTLVASQARTWLLEQTALAREFFLGKQGGEYAMMQDGGILVDGVLKLYENAVWAEFAETFLAIPDDRAADARLTQ